MAIGEASGALDNYLKAATMNRTNASLMYRTGLALRAYPTNPLRPKTMPRMT
jgi:hypothetical protein